jgi:hypothetical protein
MRQLIRNRLIFATSIVAFALVYLVTFVIVSRSTPLPESQNRSWGRHATGAKIDVYPTTTAPNTEITLIAAQNVRRGEPLLTVRISGMLAQSQKSQDTEHLDQGESEKSSSAQPDGSR